MTSDFELLIDHSLHARPIRQLDDRAHLGAEETVLLRALEQGVDAAYMQGTAEAFCELTEVLRQGDTLLLLGAGDVDEMLEDLRGSL